MNKLIDLDFWNRKKVLITGHTGFKGSWMSTIMKQLNAEVYGLSNIQKKGTCGNIEWSILLNIQKEKGPCGNI